MLEFKRYNTILSVFIALPLLLLTGFAIVSQPLSGDLTRIGGFSESDFGWNEPQKAFTESHFYMAETIEDYVRYFDVVVLGDSFSADTLRGWQNHFVEKTGLSVIFFYMHKGFTVNDILNSKTYKEAPPKIFIYESVERAVLLRLHELAGGEKVAESFAQTKILSRDTLRGSELPKRELFRSNDVNIEKRFSEAANYIKKETARVLGVYKGDAIELELVSGDLFTSSSPKRLLVVKDDFKERRKKEDVVKAVSGLMNLRARIEHGGKTKFVFLMFPDKLTAYSRFLTPGTEHVPSYFPSLAEYYPMLRLDEVFDAELQKGAVDLYLPNDTHTGYFGHKLAALSLVDYIFSQ